MFVRPVVTREPGLGADHGGVHIVTHEVVGVFGSLPLHESRVFGVSGSDHLSWSRWDTCINQKHNVKTLPILSQMSFADSPAGSEDAMVDCL